MGSFMLKVRMMKKILIAFDGTNFSKGAFEFVRQMNEQSPVFVAGVFLPQVDYANLWSYAEGVGDKIFIPLVEEETALAIEKNIDTFKSMCHKNNIEYTVHKDFFDLAIPGIKKETRFADLLVIGSQSFYENFGANEPNDSLRDTLHRSECPVIIVPENFQSPSTNILAYDGSDDCTYAIKQFTYLFSNWCKNETLLAYVGKGNDSTIPDREYIEELASRHFSKLTVAKLQIEPRKFFGTWLEDHGPSILVSGAFSRSGLSQTFRKSFITEVIRDHKIPVFIAHL